MLSRARLKVSFRRVVCAKSDRPSVTSNVDESSVPVTALPHWQRCGWFPGKRCKKYAHGVAIELTQGSEFTARVRLVLNCDVACKASFLHFLAIHLVCNMRSYVCVP